MLSVKVSVHLEDVLVLVDHDALAHQLARPVPSCLHLAPPEPVPLPVRAQVTRHGCYLVPRILDIEIDRCFKCMKILDGLTNRSNNLLTVSIPWSALVCGHRFYMLPPLLGPLQQ